MTGRWYATEQYDTRSKCLTYDFTEDSTNPSNKMVVKVNLGPQFSFDH